MCAFMGVAATFVSSTLVKKFGILKVSLAFHFYFYILHIRKHENLLYINYLIENILFSRLGQLGWCFKLYFSAWLLLYI